MFVACIILGGVVILLLFLVAVLRHNARVEREAAFRRQFCHWCDHHRNVHGKIEACACCQYQHFTEPRILVV